MKPVRALSKLTAENSRLANKLRGSNGWAMRECSHTNTAIKATPSKANAVVQKLTPANGCRLAVDAEQQTHQARIQQNGTRAVNATSLPGLYARELADQNGGC